MSLAYTIPPLKEMQKMSVGDEGKDKEVNGAMVEFGKEMRKLFLLEEGYNNLNHGSFGTYPAAVREAFLNFQIQSERRPDHFIRYIYPKLLEQSRAALAPVLNVDINTLVFVPNATTGVNTVLRSLRFEEGDKIIYWEFTYGACECTVNYIEETTPAKGVKIVVDLPCSNDEIVKAFRETILREGGGVFNGKERAKGESRVRVAMFDTVVSMPGVRLPFERLVEVCRELGVYSLIDGAHGIGHVPLDLGKLDPDFFVSNCHKWLHAPRACAVFYVPTRNQPFITSLPTSHGFIPSQPNASPPRNPLPPSSKPPYISMYEFVGTHDNSPYLSIPAALSFRKTVCGGEDKIMKYCKSIARKGAEMIAKEFGTEILDNEEGTLTDCCMANARLPIGVAPTTSSSKPLPEGVVAIEQAYAMQALNYITSKMVEEHDTFIALMLYKGSFWVRISGQIYLDEEDLVKGVKVLRTLVGEVKEGRYMEK